MQSSHLDLLPLDISTVFIFLLPLYLPLLCACHQLRNINLSCVRTCMVVAEERPRIALTQSFSKIFKDLGLSPRAVSTTFGCRVNVAICLQVRRGAFTFAFTYFILNGFCSCYQIERNLNS